jgi:hypothetical protein
LQPSLRYNNQVEATLIKTISKSLGFVILILSLSFVCGNCSSAATQTERNSNRKQSENYQAPRVIGTISSPEIKESSGIIASRCSDRVLWTHNDSGDGAFIYALNEKGEKLGTWKVSGAENTDWEDIATFKNEKGECFLLIGDIGNNARIRDVFTIYRVKEPKISEIHDDSSKKNPGKTATAEAIKIEYPDLRRDSETLMINPKNGEIYVLSKSLSDSSVVYKLAVNYSLDKINKLEKIADFAVPAIPNGFLTGGDISPDGKRIVICDYFSAYEIVLPEKAKNFGEIWKQKPQVIELGERAQGEAVCYSADGKSIFATSEKKNSPLIQVSNK